MWNQPSIEQLKNIPELYSTDEITLKDKLIYLHFFMSGCDWYIAEYDSKFNLFFGFAIINGDIQNAEWGIIPFDELVKMKMSWMEVDCDLYWKVKKASEINKIKRCINGGCCENY